MEQRYLDRLEAAAREIGLTPHLESEAEYWLNEVERDDPETLGAFLDEWHDRHQHEPKAGWLDRKSLDVIRRAYIKARIAIPKAELDARYFQRFTAGGGDRVWFRKGGIAYEFEPEFDEEVTT